MNQGNVKTKKISEEKVWLKYFGEKIREKKTPQTTAYRFVKDSNAQRADKVALHYYGTNITHAQLQRNIDAVADSFYALGVRQGDIVSFLSVAIPETIYSIYALNKLGATANTIDPRMDIDSIRRSVLESGSNILLTMDIVFPKVSAILEDIRQDYIITMSAARSLPFFKKMAMKYAVKTNITYSDKIIEWNTFCKKGKGFTAVEAPYVGDAVFAITYTGGTTGFPKGVMITNDSINAAAFNFKYSGLVYERGDRFLDIIPVFTSYGMCCGMHMPLALGLEVVPVPRFEPQKFGKLVKQFRPAHMISTPAFYEILMNSKEMQNLNLSFLITLGSGGDTINEGLEEKLSKFMKDHNIRYPLAQGYGMSELSAAASFCVNDIYKPGSVGIPAPTTIISVFDDETGEELSYNQIGEICATGPSMMKGYYNRKEETDNVMREHSDGRIWIHSGDLGYMDEDGFIFIIGRKKRMITRFDGHKVFPVNIEGLISKHKEVKNCSVIGVRDMERSQGHYPLALVEFADSVENREEFCRKLLDECNESLEERGRPVAVIEIESVPLTGSGKNDYRTLEKEYRNFDYLAVSQP